MYIARYIEENVYLSHMQGKSTCAYVKIITLQESTSKWPADFWWTEVIIVVFQHNTILKK